MVGARWQHALCLFEEIQLRKSPVEHDVVTYTYNATNMQGKVQHICRKYANNTGGVWHLQNVDTTMGTGEYTSIAIDSNNVAHISYYNNSDLNYCNNIDI